MDLGNRVAIVVVAGEQGPQLQCPEAAVEVGQHLLDLGAQGVVPLLLDQLVERLGVGQPPGEAGHQVDVLGNPAEFGGDRPRMVGIVPEAGLGGRPLELDAALGEAVDGQEVPGLTEALGQRRQGIAKIDAFGLAVPAPGTIGRRHLSWRRGRT